MKILIILGSILLLSCNKTENTLQKDGFSFRYYKVIAKSGLRLRESPSIKSNKIDLLPYKHVGEILEKTKDIQTIENKSGYWIKTQFNDKTGWIFSGFILLSESTEFYFMNPDYSIKFVELSQKNKLEFDAKSKLKEEKIGNYNVIVLKNKINEMDTKELYFEKDKIFYFNPDAAEEWVQKHKLPFKNILITGMNTCLECCGLYEQYYNLYSLSSEIQLVGFLMEDRKGECGEIIEGQTDEIVNKFDPKTLTIYHYRHTPKCEYNFNNGIITDYLENNILLSLINFNEFGKIINITNYENEDIPKDILIKFKSNEFKKLSDYF